MATIIILAQHCCDENSPRLFSEFLVDRFSQYIEKRDRIIDKLSYFDLFVQSQIVETLSKGRIGNGSCYFQMVYMLVFTRNAIEVLHPHLGPPYTLSMGR